MHEHRWAQKYEYHRVEYRNDKLPVDTRISFLLPMNDMGSTSNPILIFVPVDTKLLNTILDIWSSWQSFQEDQTFSTFYNDKNEGKKSVIFTTVDEKIYCIRNL